MENLNLSYVVKKKTEKLLDLKSKLDNKKSRLMLPYALTGMLVLYVTLFNQRYFNYASAAFNASNKKIYGLEFLDLTIFILALINIAVLWYSLNQYNKLKSSFQSLKQDIKKSIDNKLCNCSNCCNCKDEYVKFMESQKIDLIF